MVANCLTFADVAAAYECEVWPDNWPAATLFVDLMTQWRVGMGGPLGLDYTAVPVVMDLRDIKPADREAIFDDLRVMEAAALTQMRSRH